ncbi:MAG: hypothetical protein R3E48_08645 [Burkholderiaceae bacterium]
MRWVVEFSQRTRGRWISSSGRVSERKKPAIAQCTFLRQILGKRPGAVGWWLRSQKLAHALERIDARQRTANCATSRAARFLRRSRVRRALVCVDGLVGLSLGVRRLVFFLWAGLSSLRTFGSSFFWASGTVEANTFELGLAPVSRSNDMGQPSSK